MNLNGNLRKEQCQPALLIIQNVGNVTPKQNTPQTENLSKPEIKNNKKIRSKHIPKNNKEWYDLMEIDNEKDSEPSDSEYDIAEEEPDIHFEKIKNPYNNRIAEAKKFNEGEVCNYYAFVPKGYYTEGEPLAFFESIEKKIADIYKKELALKEDEALQESGWSFVRAEEVFLEISAFRPLRSSSYLYLPEALNKPQLGLINPQNRDDNECFKWCISAYHTREEAIKNNRKPPHFNEIRRLRRNANIANYEGIKFPATLHDIDKFEEINQNYAINIFRPVFSKAFGKIKVDIDLLYISERNYQVEHMIDLLYLTEGEENLNDRKNPNDIPEGLKTYYVLITDFTRLMHKWNNYYDKKYFCRKCLRFPYSRLDLLKKHIPACPGPNKAPQRLILPEEEVEEVEVEEKDKEGNTIKIAEQKAVSYGYTIHCSDGTTQKLQISVETVKKISWKKNNDLRSGYDFHHLIQEIAKVTDEKIVPIANNSEQYITFLVGQLQFIDSLKFLLPGLAKMAENLRDEKKGQTKTPEQLAKCFPIIKKKFNETKLPLCKEFNSDLDGFNYCDHNCRIEKYEYRKKIGKCEHKCQKCKHKKEPARRCIARANIPGLEGFKWLSTNPLDASHSLVQKILTIKEKSNRGCCLEVKLSIPKELYSKFRDYPMCPERKNVLYDWYSSKQKE
ncbi:21586_t:CDS:10 [Dentiscutata erythropus]|uniref:21586_t:CDS:1 n=1 Tax=Dentiscutata erythropus TaxID=1348616 RepID=A0A9N8ZY55_9GLOM|nr:21586_t:CDS:10 [Dentiscutata erythropus]